MKVDIFNWKEIAPNEEHECKEGRLQIMCSHPSANLYLTAQGYEVLVAYGQKIDVTFKEKVTYRIEAPKAARVFVYCPIVETHRNQGEIFTNIDRKPNESGTLLEIKKALRGLMIQQKTFRQEVENETRALKQERKKSLKKSEEKPEPKKTEPEPEKSE